MLKARLAQLLKVDPFREAEHFLDFRWFDLAGSVSFNAKAGERCRGLMHPGEKTKSTDSTCSANEAGVSAHHNLPVRP